MILMQSLNEILLLLQKFISFRLTVIGKDELLKEQVAALKHRKKKKRFDSQVYFMFYKI